MGQETSGQEILEKINNKGWNLYYRGKIEEKISTKELYQKGPVDNLEKNVIYIILPQIDQPNSRKAMENFLEKYQLQPLIIVPSRFHNSGRKISNFPLSGESEDILTPGEKIPIVGIELLNKEVRLIAPVKTFMPYEVFMVALDKLQNITRLTKLQPAGCV